MPLKLEITGNDVQELYVNAANMLILLSRGGNEMFKAAPQPAAEPVVETAAGGPPGAPSAEPAPAESEPVGDVTKIEEPVGQLPKRGRKKAEKPVDPPDDPIPDFLDRREKSVDEVKDYTLDDMKALVKQIVDAHTARGNDMPTCVAYVRKLFEPFAIKKAIELKPEQFADFVAAAKPYIDGTAK